ncbi:hypothetical protein HX045_10410 [Myroides odoratimimus]|uniref:Uncharacterized protein n=4 Tax=Myroides TaxID=76831 RepID=A0A0S7EA57_9FLAO|nr:MULTISPECIES: hypothetical protein [Myroides]AJA68150.1 hypothetical protein MYRA21_0975 [Myroides sp. A21]AJH16619.1 hypothetical protein MPR_3507 [Myroides profundi]ALU25457.1 hypothetical protein AS202_04510 [Myroides odoratimimus]APA91477.1 hypothetical protein BK054_04405 [Myroides sp. ZB35]EHO05190.1 hypothetical protein HMPREF9714_03553 [Myroides odoratimimus CCUG 12901]
MKIEEVQQQIMQLMVLIAQNKKEEASVAIEKIEESINDGLDYAQTDDEVVRWGKFLKIIEELKQKIG